MLSRANLLRCLLMAFLASPVAADAGPYEDALPQSKTDALQPTSRDWYLSKMRPAFGVLFQSLLNQCSSKMSSATQASFGLVFTVTPSGSVKQVLWRTPNEFTACLEPGLRAATFPPSPKEEFYFGLGGS